MLTVIKFALPLYLVPWWICYAKTPQQNEAVITTFLLLEMDTDLLAQSLSVNALGATTGEATYHTPRQPYTNGHSAQTHVQLMQWAVSMMIM